MKPDNAPVFHFVEPPGSHAVGLRTVEQYDYSRTYRHPTDEHGKPFEGERARPLQTLIWYPAEPDGGEPMTVGDYVGLWATETSFGNPRLPAMATEWIAAMEPALATTMWAVRDSPPVPRRFPLVVYAPSFSSSAWENADLCEYLASHGYVVIAAPSMGVTSRGMTADLRGIDAQAGDISFLIGYARTLPNADLSEIGVVGFSWGGIANLFAAARDNRITALVALDGSLRYWPWLVREAGDVHPDQMTIPLLYLARAEWTLEDYARYPGPDQGEAPNVLNAWTHGDLLTVHMLGMTHRECSSMFQRNEEMWKDFHDQEFADRQRGDYGREHGIPAYGWMARYTLQFLSAYLRHDSAAMAFLGRTPAENGAPQHFMAADRRAGLKLPASLESFRAEVGRRGFDHASEIYEAMREKNADLTLDEVAVNAWAEELLDASHLVEAIALLQLNLRMHPESSVAHAGLGRAYHKAAQPGPAIECYRNAVEKNPLNAEARRKLAELG